MEKVVYLVAYENGATVLEVREMEHFTSRIRVEVRITITW